MTLELVKRQDRYDLYGTDGSKIASSAKNPFGKLSKENCDDIFGVVDVDVFIDEMLVNRGEHISRVRNKIYGEERDLGRECFNKAMELNKDKLFTEFDIIKAFEYGWNQRHFDKTDENELREIQKRFIQSLQQPTEIDVEIEVLLTERDGGVVIETPKLDKNGCLILTKKK